MQISTRFSCSRALRTAARLRAAFLAALSLLAMSGSTALAARAAQGADGEAAQRGVAGFSRTDGYVPFYFDGAKGRVLMEIIGSR